MTKEERQALREKHSDWYGFCLYCHDASGDVVEYPCDVIKALDWADEVLEELKSLTAHFEGIWY